FPTRRSSDLCQTGVGEALALEAEHQVAIHVGQPQLAQALLFLDEILDLHQEPGVDLGQLEDALDTHAGTEGITDVPDTLGTRHGQLRSEEHTSELQSREK